MGRRHWVFPVFLLLALVSLASAQACNLAGPVSFQNLITRGMLPWAIAITIGIIVLAKMFADAVNSAPLQAWVKAELWELVVTVFLIASIPIFAVILDNVTCNFLGTTPTHANPAPDGNQTLYHCDWDNVSIGGGNRNIFSVSHFFLGCGATEGVLLPKLSKTYLDLMTFEFTMAGLASWQINIPLPAYTIVVSSIMIMPYSGTNPVADAHVFVVDAVGLALASVAAQNMLLNFIQSVVIAGFLPLGVLFRSIPVTRKVGTTIIAVVFIAYFVYPSTVVLAYHSYNNAKAVNFVEFQNKVELSREHDPAKIEERLNETFGQLAQQRSEFFGPTAPIKDGFWNKFWYYLREGGSWAKRWFLTLWAPLADPFGISRFFGLETAREEIGLFPADTTLYLFDAVTDETTAAGQLLAFMTMSLVMSIIISITLFRDISSVMGGEGRIIGISKLV